MTANQSTFYFQSHDAYLWPCGSPDGEGQVKVVCGREDMWYNYPADCSNRSAWCDPPVELAGFQVGKTKFC